MKLVDTDALLTAFTFSIATLTFLAVAFVAGYGFEAFVSRHPLFTVIVAINGLASTAASIIHFLNVVRRNRENSPETF